MYLKIQDFVIHFISFYNFILPVLKQWLPCMQSHEACIN